MSPFPVLSPENAPAGSQPLLMGAKSAFGFVPNLLGMLAEAPAALEGYMGIAAAFQKSSLTPVEQQVVLLTVSVTNRCRYCVAAHTMIAMAAHAPPEVIEALRDGRPIPDARLEALRSFTEILVQARGWAAEGLAAFYAAGFSKAQVLEVVTGVAQKTLSNYANHLAETPVDAAFAKLAWDSVEV